MMLWQFLVGFCDEYWEYLLLQRFKYFFVNNKNKQVYVDVLGIVVFQLGKMIIEICMLGNYI